MAEVELFDLGGDIQMSDDELERELKQLEAEDNVAETPSSVDKKDKLDTETDTQKKSKTNQHAVKVNCEKSPTKTSNEKASRCAIYDEFDKESSQRPHGGGNNNGYTHRRNFHREKDSIDLKRLNKPLHISSTCDAAIIGREVAYRLNEPKTTLFGHVVRVLGAYITSDIFAETKQIVNQGGIKTDLGDRKRSPGGTFLYLMKSRGYATPEQVKEIFKEDNVNKKQAKKRAREAHLVRQENEMIQSIDNGNKKKKKRIKEEEKGDVVRDGNDNICASAPSVIDGTATPLSSSATTSGEETAAKRIALPLGSSSLESTSKDGSECVQEDLEDGEID